jgi:hypothetical protein
MVETRSPAAVDAPPIETGPSGAERRVGVEIEFAGLDVAKAARIVRRVFGGTLETESAHRVTVSGSDVGDFTVELDAQMAHKKADDADAAETAEVLSDIETKSREVLGRAISVVVPTEIVCPPIPWSDLGRVDKLIGALRAEGAEGTEAGVLYGFGLHLNPEVAEATADYALRHLCAYLILEDWLRDEIGIDPMRRVLPHIDPFPADYVRHVMAQEDTPDTATLIREYGRANPTRNRGLDMTPLFRHMDEKTLVSVMPDTTLIKARPTFHYRLPDARLSDPRWGVAVEWNRWLAVERLAADTDTLRERRRAYAAWLNRPAHERWLQTLQAWLNE